MEGATADAGGIWLAATGDLMLDRPPRDPEAIRKLFGRADLVLTNLEVPLTDRGYPADKLVTLRASPLLAHELPRLGIHVASLANNHALDYGVEGMLQTIDALVNAGVRPCGTGPNWEAAAEPLLIELGGLWLAILSLACTVPAGWAAGPERPGLAAIRVTTELLIEPTVHDEQPGTSPYVRTRAVEEDVELALAAVRRAREQADFVVVALHWGVPPGWAAAFQGPLADYQRPLGHRLVEAGAGLIVGNHAHTALGVEVYRGALIAYSLGNFLFHTFRGGALMPIRRPAPPYDLSAFRGHDSFESFVLRARIDCNGLRAVELHPIALDDEAEPTETTARAAEGILKRIQQTSPDPAVVEIDGTVGHVRLGVPAPAPSTNGATRPGG